MELPPKQFIEDHIIGKENIFCQSGQPVLSSGLQKEARHFLFHRLPSIRHNASVIQNSLFTLKLIEVEYDLVSFSWFRSAAQKTNYKNVVLSVLCKSAGLKDM